MPFCVGHPIRGGLYDPVFGPLEPNDRCETCKQYDIHCPGHFGHIRLDVPVFSPIHFSFCFNLLKGSCVQCHRFTCDTSGVATKILLAQLRCFELGVPHLAQEIETQFKELLTYSRTTLISKEDEMQMLAELDKLIADNIAQPATSSVHLPTKISVDLRRTIIKNYLRDHLFKRKARCPLCKGFNGQIRNDGYQCVLVDFTVHGSRRKKSEVSKYRPVKEESEEDVNYDSEEGRMFNISVEKKFTFTSITYSDKKDVLLEDIGYGNVDAEGALDLQMKAIQSGACEKLAWRAAEIREHFRLLYKTEGKLLLKLFPMLTDEGELDKRGHDRVPGIKQILEKKQGLFRMNMMGKRVNFACRSVITPDPYLDIDEIGVPEMFAKKLTFTEPVNLFNKEKLRKCVRNGPNIHPGANYVVNSSNIKQMLPGAFVCEGKKKRSAIANSLAPASTEKLREPVKFITLCRARVLRGQRVLRMNYAPCKAYNADFDGDEMNGHFVQSYIAQCEVAELANVGSNFLVPRDASPLLGLIQDHVVAGVLLTMRGRFLSKIDFMHLVLAAFAEHASRIEIPQPAIIKPHRMWSGKQVVRNAFGLDENVSHEEIERVLASVYSNPQGQNQDVKLLDYCMKQTMSKYNDVISKACVPNGLIRQFPENSLQVMIQSGAKGSAVNAIQISCCLGQIELEGKRMALTAAGRSLPSFRCKHFYGILLQGLIDTAVKTSRSGYLQRCLIKHLEGLKIYYDGTVRDHDGSVVQFRYGEDGLDVTKSTYMNPKAFAFLQENLRAVIQSSKPENVRDSMFNVEAAEKQYRKIKKWRRKASHASGHVKKQYVSGFTEFSADQKGLDKKRVVAMWAEMNTTDKKAFEKRTARRCPHAVDAIPIISGTPRERIDAIRRELGKVFLKEVVHKFSIEERINLSRSDCWRRYSLRIETLSASKRQENARHLSRKTILHEVEQRFLRILTNAIAKKHRDILDHQQIQHRKLKAANISVGLGSIETSAVNRSADYMNDGNSSDEEVVGGKEADAGEQRLHNRHLDDVAEYEGEDEDRVHVENDDDGDQNQDDFECSEEEQKDEEGEVRSMEQQTACISKESAAERIRFVTSLSSLIFDYKFDVNSERWCEVVFSLPLINKSKLDLATIVEIEINKFVVHQTPGIERCIEIEEIVQDIPTKYLQTQGVNFEAFYRHSDVLDVNAIYTNDLNLLLQQYGVEACSKAIMQCDSPQ
ncbi:RNA polymerase Rpb1, domain 2 [Dictyocaulus viviparus]|uniref:DNA-directed RNA polymerase subunit n=1 Tax=Dictyocaulus viviparus TaxID=29172 RepID=A0A0D8XES4_DICVI|nr:RNA polymerase Rpb1, domain 2 [Dictyocaulus viviparus]